MTDVPTVEVISIELLDNPSSLRAVASIVYDNTIIHQVRVIHADAWVSEPQLEYYKNGKRQWTSVVEWAPALRQAISDAVLHAYYLKLAPTQTPAVSPSDIRMLICTAILDCPYPSTANEIKQAYKQKVRLVHPDAGGSADAFISVQNAYTEAMELVGRAA